MNIEGFDLSAPYADKKNFPYGFHRSGEFSITQAEIMESYGRALSELALGNKIAVTNEEKSFMSVCKGEKEPSSPIEIAWLKYQTLLKRKNIVKVFV